MPIILGLSEEKQAVSARPLAAITKSVDALDSALSVAARWKMEGRNVESGVRLAFLVCPDEWLS